MHIYCFYAADDCTAAAPPTGMKEAANIGVGDTVTNGYILMYSCADGYSIEGGDGAMTCTAGTLSVITLTCATETCKLYRRHVDLNSYRKNSFRIYYPWSILVVCWSVGFCVFQQWH